MSKALKTVVSVAAVVAIPYAAPYFAGSIGLSGAITSAATSVGMSTAAAGTFGNIAGAALMGGAMGGVASAATGGDWRRGALMGGIGGGIGGALKLGPAGSAGAGGGSVGSTGALPNYGTVSYGGVPMPSLATNTPGVVGFSGLVEPSVVIGNGVSGLPGGPGLVENTRSALGRVWDEGKKQLTDPKKLADLTLRAAGRLAGSALAGDGLSSEEQALLDQETANLQNMQRQNAQLFNTRLQEAMGILGDAKYFDPDYFGLQSARRMQIAGAHAKRSGLRGLEGNARLSAGRKYDLQTARNVGTAYDTGYLTGVQGRLATKEAGIRSLPTEYPNMTAGYSQLRDAYDTDYRRKRQQQADIGGFFGGLFGIPDDAMSKPQET